MVAAPSGLAWDVAGDVAEEAPEEAAGELTVAAAGAASVAGVVDDFVVGAVCICFPGNS